MKPTEYHNPAIGRRAEYRRAVEEIRELAATGRPNACEAAAAAREAAFLGASLAVAAAVADGGTRDALDRAAREIHETHERPDIALALWNVVDTLDRLNADLPHLVDREEVAHLLA